MCVGCPHRGMFYALNRKKVFVAGDIGCYTLGALPPYTSMDTCVDMGASITLAQGIEIAEEVDDAQLVAGRAIRHALGAAPPGGRADTGSALPEPR